MSVETLLLLRRCLTLQQLSVGDPTFPEMARQVCVALAELDQAIEQAPTEAAR